MKKGKYSRKQFAMPVEGLLELAGKQRIRPALDLESPLSRWCEELAKRYGEHLVESGLAKREPDGRYTIKSKQ
jgi:hypothetical protein